MFGGLSSTFLSVVGSNKKIALYLKLKFKKMDRKKFLKKGLLGFGSIIAIPTVISSCSKDDDNSTSTDSCTISPTETKGPFPILTPTQLVRASIIGNRTGVAMLMTLTIQDKSNGCAPLAGVLVDVWHCDKDGNYSQYGGTQLQTTNYTNETFLRGRQTTDSNGKVSFISIFPGWYSGRAPHIHVEVLSASGSSLLISQIAFPKNICDTVYATSGYKGTANQLNETDNVFSNSLSLNMADSLTGDVTNGYTLLKTIVVS
jgi:protocatechuate 3,4-dioxygenase beta subunit